MANKSSNISLNIQANTQKALNQFKSFSADLQNKFLISGLQLDFVRNALSSINREFERYAGGGGLSEAVQTQQLTRSLQASLSVIQGYSAEVSRTISDNIGLALSKINVQVGGNKDEIISFTNEISTAINEQVAVGLTGSKNLVTANEQIYSLMQQLKLGYGESIEEMTPLFKKILLNQITPDELLGSVSGGTANLIRQAMFESGGQLGNMSGANRGAFIKRIQELAVLNLPSTEELIKTNPQAILGKLLNTLFDDRVGIFGALRQVKLPSGETTTILQEGAKLLNALFGEKGFIIQFTRTIAKEFGFGEGPDAPAQGIIALIRWMTETANGFTRALKEAGFEGFIDQILDVFDKLIEALPVERLAETLSKVLDKFSKILLKVLERVPASLTELIKKSMEVIFKTIWNVITGKGNEENKEGGGTPGSSSSPGGGGGGGFSFARLLLGTLGLGTVGGLAFAGKNLYQNYMEGREESGYKSERQSLRREEIANTNELRKERDEIRKLARERNKLSAQVKAGTATEAQLTEANNKLEAARERAAAIESRNTNIANRKGEIELNEMDLESRRNRRQNSLQNRWSRLPRGVKIGGGIAGSILMSLLGGMIPDAETSLGKGLQGIAPFLSLLGPWGMLASAGLTLGGGWAGDRLSGLFGIKYNGNFPTAANGLFSAMGKESLMSGGKGLVIANQDEIIAPPQRLAQLAGMISNMSGAGREQYALNEKFKKYQDEQKKQMKELISEVKVGNMRKSQPIQTAPTTINQVENKIDTEALKKTIPTNWWENLTSSISNNFIAPVNGILTRLGLPTIKTMASGNITSGFLQAYKSEMNAYGGNPVLANDKELIVSPRNYSTLASLLGQMGGSSKASIKNEININVNSNGEVDTNKIAKAVMKAIDTRYQEVYQSLSYA